MAALADTPVVVVVGGRQTGKSTLAKSLAEKGHPAKYVTFDDPTVLAAARRDPAGFVDDLDGPVVLDEIQRAPELFLPIKASVDRDRQPGRFLLTGSANVLLVPSMADALVGRVEILTLWPFSTAELQGRPEGRILDLLFADRPALPDDEAPDRSQLIDRLLRGGYPEAVERDDEARRHQWFSNYLTTVMERDVRALADVERLEELPALLTAIALRSRGPLNKSSLSQDLGIANSSLDRYLLLLDRVFVVRRFSAWHNRLHPRLVKAPKLLISDSGLLCRLLHAGADRLATDAGLLGLILEGYVGMELVKNIEVAQVSTSAMHYRTSRGIEIDFLIESTDGRVAGVEVKAGKTVDAQDFKRFERLERVLGDRFARGVVLYTGDRAVPFGDRLAAWPISLL
jgi:predicted AAA+ superfamily ATPase